MKLKELSLDERLACIEAVADEVSRGKLLGGAAQRLREDILGVNQEWHAKASKISKRALSQLESDSGNPTLATLEAVFAKFGLHVSLTRLNPAEMDAARWLRRKDGFVLSPAAKQKSRQPY